MDDYALVLNAGPSSPKFSVYLHRGSRHPVEFLLISRRKELP